MHVVTVNDYLAKRDAQWMGRIHRFLGLTVGIHDVHYKHYGVYGETLEPNPENIGSLQVNDERKITGSGFDINEHACAGHCCGYHQGSDDSYP